MDDDDGRDNWDLSAVVKSCSSRKPTVQEEEEPPLACLASLTFHDQEGNSSGFLQRYPDIGKYGSSFQSSYSNPFLSSMTTGNTDNYLSDLVNPPPVTSLPSPDQLCPDLQADVHASMSGIGPPPLPASAPSPPVLFFQQKQLVHAGRRPFNRIRTQDPPPPSLCRFAAPHPSRSRKRKVQQKRTVTHVTADKLSSDEWAWRKYGQKPIKGSPYPRNYYRCSSSKGCSARKQVEQSKSDPEIYTVTFTGDHTHPRPSYRNSLAGSTRSRVGLSSQRLAAEASTEGSSSTLVSVTSHTAAPGVEEAETEGMVDVGSEEEEEDVDLLIPNLVIDDDLFKGLEEFTSGGGFGQSPSSFGDNFSASGDCGSSPAGGATAAGSG